MTACCVALLTEATLACASLDAERGVVASSPHPRVFGLPLPLAILSIMLVVPLFWAFTATVGRFLVDSAKHSPCDGS